MPGVTILRFQDDLMSLAAGIAQAKAEPVAIGILDPDRQFLDVDLVDRPAGLDVVTSLREVANQLQAGPAAATTAEFDAGGRRGRRETRSRCRKTRLPEVS